jgi:hypothetical protein
VRLKDVGDASAQRLPRRARITAATLLILAVAAGALGLPEVPAIDRDVALVRGNEFSHPHIPPLRTTADGRVGISPKPNYGMVQFYALVPESFTTPFVGSPPGDRILAASTPYEVPETEFHGSDDTRRRHYALCDTTAEFHAAGELTSPYACGATGGDDCYDFVVITSSSFGFRSRKRQLWGTPVTVRVSNPKTVDAAIARVTTGAPRPGPLFQGEFFFETMTTSDGRLLSGRIATLDFEWVVPGTNEERRHYADLVYSFNAAREACDVGAWDTFYPISHAPHDPAINSRYGFAMHPFRDATGRTLPDGADLGISYPWIDRHGTNLFFTSVGALLTLDGRLSAGDGGKTRYPTRCIPNAQCSERVEYFDRTRGQGVVGLWTRGKMVLLDGLLNNTDYGLELDEGGHRLVELYRPGSGPRGDESGEVRVGTGRGSSDGSGPATYIGNANVVDSLENLFHALPQMQPVTPRDVTWIVNSGKASDEIAFDDWLDLDAFIVSEMVGATSYVDTGPGTGGIVYHDGWQGGAFGAPVRIQNAASALPQHWQVPDAGIAFGDVRLEPIALGGIRGKGLWLDGQSGVEYEIAEQRTSTEDVPWYLGIFLDSRFADDESERTLIGFPNGARISLRGRSRILYSRPDGTTAHQVDLVEPLPHGSWSHLGFQLLANRTGVVLYLDGFALDLAPADTDPLRLSPGSLFVGDDPRHPAGGVRGWIDNFIVIAREIGPELACNHAAGTLAALSEDTEPAPISSREWVEMARLYPPWAHERIRSRLAAQEGATATPYVCFHGYHGDYENHPASLPEHLRSVRRELTFPEGPLAYGRPRPDSSTNSFCLSCHSSDGRGGLGIGALAERPGEPMEDDPRRQPSQPLRRVFGNLPANWMGNGRPATAVVAPASGLKIDALLEGVIQPVEAGAALEPCAGDCDTNLNVTIGEITLAVRIALGGAPFGLCRRAFDCGPSDNCIGIAQLTRAVRNALDGCSPQNERARPR